MAYFSNLLTATKSRYQSIRGDTDDGDTEDDSHLARCLRAYYQENERPIPDWLGGGPPPAQSLRQTNKMAPPGHSRQGVNASLSDIWDNPQPQRFQQQPPPGGGGGGGGPGQRHHHQQQPGLFPDERRPTPVQDGPGGAGKALTSAQQRIKERLWGGRTASPPPQGQFSPPPPPQSVQMPGEHMFGGGAPPPRRQGGGGGGMPWENEAYSGAPGYYGGGGGSGSGGNLRRPQQGGGGGRVGLQSGSGVLRGQRGGGY